NVRKACQFNGRVTWTLQCGPFKNTYVAPLYLVNADTGCGGQTIIPDYPRGKGGTGVGGPPPAGCIHCVGGGGPVGGGGTYHPPFLIITPPLCQVCAQ